MSHCRLINSPHMERQMGQTKAPRSTSERGRHDGHLQAPSINYPGLSWNPNHVSPARIREGEKKTDTVSMDDGWNPHGPLLEKTPRADRPAMAETTTPKSLRDFQD